MATSQEILAAARTRFPNLNLELTPLLVRGGEPGSQFYIRVEPRDLLSVLRFLRDDELMRFEQLIDLTCVDYLNFPGASDRYGVIYSLLSLTHNHRIWVKCFVNDPKPAVPSVTVLWKGAEWMEREVYDMFGITFEGHPDLRRILTWDGFEAHPLRKDYPLRGKGERENYPVIHRDDA
ncbi:MAG: NADH-quinone oxidoreductase subunit C [Planctomycetota bacterium]|nr:MAG: NADH-quinone oxidoreductase subunit C [Planctomycetota bacterium]